MDSSWCLVDVVRNICRHRQRPCCPITLQPVRVQGARGKCPCTFVPEGYWLAQRSVTNCAWCLYGAHRKVNCRVQAPGSRWGLPREPETGGSTARRTRASVHMTRPLLSRRTRAGMVVTLNFANRAFPQGPATVACGIAVHIGIV
jgi:hypothetical protein